VKYFTPPGELSVSYQIGTSKETVRYSFYQYPCAFDTAYEVYVV